MTALPNPTSWGLRVALADWLEEHYADALQALSDSDPLALPDGAPEWRVVPFRSKITADLPCYVLDLRLETLRPPEVGGGNRRVHVVSLHLVSPHADADADGELDAMLSALLDTLTTTSNGIRWTEAVYAIRDDAYPAYAITLNLEEAR